MEFTSARFRGDPVLEEILNDLDTGTKKLEPGSPADSVQRVQQALFDLGWTRQAFPDDPPAERDFVIGVYGPKTLETVRGYKEHYNIHFPGHPPGVFDGFTGPRTMRELDFHIHLFGQAAVAIDDKAAALVAAGLTVTLDPDTDTVTATEIIMGAPAAFRRAEINGTKGELIHWRGGGTFDVHGLIFAKWVETGGALGPLGLPTSDQFADDTGGLRSNFRGGFIRFDAVTDTVSAELVSSSQPPLEPGF